MLTISKLWITRPNIITFCEKLTDGSATATMGAQFFFMKKLSVWRREVAWSRFRVVSWQGCMSWMGNMKKL
ncbi:MAG: hypothetical protein BWY44_00001 [Candidatus Omnitrophica bacterium ADurb.Bin292]|nr:MAG: hypothetical protein BWY44_00001 [Candidatus Omnitrophica bacterium ADurb.Bin292]